MRGRQIVLVLLGALAFGGEAHSVTVDSPLSSELALESQYRALGRGGCFGTPYLPMGSPLMLGAMYDPMVNCFPGLTLDPWMMSGGADGRYYPGYPWVPQDPAYPSAGASPYYYHSRRYKDDEPSSSSNYPYSYHSYSLSRSPSGKVSSWDSVVNKGKSPGERASAPEAPSAPSQATAGSGADAADAPLVIEPVSPRDSSLVYPSGALPPALHATAERAARAVKQPAVDSAAPPAPLVIGSTAAGGRSDQAISSKPDHGPADRRFVNGQSPALAVGPSASIGSPASEEVGGRKPMPPISPVTGQLLVPVPKVARKPVPPTVPSAVPSMIQEAPPTGGGVRVEEAMAGAAACVACKDVEAPGIDIDVYESLIESLSNSNTAVAGARKFMATLYQTCEALSKPLPLGYKMSGSRSPPDDVQSHKENPNKYFTPKKAVETHHYLAASYDGEVCRDMRKTLPVFHPGGKAGIRYSDGALTVNPFNDRPERRNLTTMDCSGFISGAMAAAGLKMRKGPNPQNAYQLGTGELIGLGSNENDCMKPARFDGNGSIQAGDVMVLRQPHSKNGYGHAMMFESAGPDPFALAAVTSATQCNDQHIDPGKWDFKVIHSSSMGGRMGVSRMTAQNILADSSSLLKLWVMDLAIQACEAKFASRGADAVVTYPLKNGRKHRGIAVVRHVGAAVPACVEDKPVRLIGEKCVKDCKELKR